MNKKYIWFIVNNFLSYFILLNLFGFDFSFYLSIFWSFIVVITNVKVYGLKDSMILAIIYLLVFDSKTFYITDLNLRFWYFYLLVVIGMGLLEVFQNGKIQIKKIFIVEFFIGAIFTLWSFYFLIVENFESKINNVKYWIFYISLLIILNRFFFRHLNRFGEILEFLIAITIFIAFWGILQFATNILFISNFQLDFYNIRPSAFFSETTWYSEFIFFGLILLLLGVLSKMMDKKLLYILPIFLTGFVLSLTRNTYVALILYIFFTFILSLIIEKKIYSSIITSRLFLLFFSILFILIIVYFPLLKDISFTLFQKFSLNDSSAEGRIEAYNESLKLIKNGNFWGNGFYWDKSQVTQSGSAIGSKSFNLILMIGSIFGFFGLGVFISLLGYVFIKIIYTYNKAKSLHVKYSFIVLLIFIQMSMFAPLHQYPFGMLVISISMLLYYKGIHQNERNNFFTSTI